MSKIERTCQYCNNKFFIWESVLKRKNRGKFCSKNCSNKGKEYRKGEKNNKWKGGISISELGYILISSPNHPYKNKHGYVREHRLVMEQKLGRFLNPSEEVHHINGIKNDNRIENLELIKSRKEHLKMEHKLGTYKKHLYQLNFTNKYGK